MSFNLFLDDVRDSKCLGDNRVWVTVRGYQDFVNMITNDGLPQLISFDHDLSWEQYPKNDDSGIIDYNDERYVKAKTGYHCAAWLIDYCQKKNLPLPQWQVHSMNPIGRINIAQLLNNYGKSNNSTKS